VSWGRQPEGKRPVMQWGMLENHAITIAVNTVIFGWFRDFWTSLWFCVTTVIIGGLSSDTSRDLVTLTFDLLTLNSCHTIMYEICTMQLLSDANLALKLMAAFTATASTDISWLLDTTFILIFLPSVWQFFFLLFLAFWFYVNKAGVGPACSTLLFTHVNLRCN